MAFFPANTSFPSLLGELYSAAFTAPAFNWLCSPACTELETVVLDWVAEMLGLPEMFLSTGGSNAGAGNKAKGGGVIQGSASEGVVVCMVAARERHVRGVLEQEGLLPAGPSDSEETMRQREDRAVEIRGRLVAMGSEYAHSGTQKAANILGVRYRNVPAGPETGFVMTGEAVKQTMKQAEDSGLVPFYLTATLGTTSTCAVDDFEGLAALKQDRQDFWIHVDAAYAGCALICPEMRSTGKARWLGSFDSFDVNMHKWLLVNFDASCLFVQNRADLISALTISPAYLQNPESLTGLVTDYRDWQIPLGRRFRALKIWFVLRSYGVSGLQKMIREHLRLGEIFGDLCKSERGRAAGIEVVTGPDFALTVLRILETGSDVVGPIEGDAVSNGDRGDREVNPRDERNAFGTIPAPPTKASTSLTKRVYELINARGEIFLTSTQVGGMYCIRVVSGTENADEKNVRRAFDIIVKTIDEVRNTASHQTGQLE